MFLHQHVWGETMINNKILLIALLLCIALPINGIAEDIDIYGKSNVTIQPNVMILMDNSGSMTTIDVPGDPYNPAIDYSTYPAKSGWTHVPRYMVYYKSSGNWYSFMDVSSLSGCDTAQSSLNTVGYAYSIRIKTTNPKACGTGTSRDLQLGNFRNYENSTASALKGRYAVAKDAIASLLNSPSANNKKFGITHFNASSEGGYVKYKCGEKTNSELATYASNMPKTDFKTNTPLAETLAEIGRYFAGISSWFNTGVTYTSPLDYSCQNNYVIIVTDGEPTSDTNNKLWLTNYIGTKKIGDAYIGPNGEDKDFDSANNLISSLLNDVAFFLYNNDIKPDTGSDTTSFDNQRIVTYTIGFTTNATANALLTLTAKNGGGEFYPAATSSSLSAALEAITQKINETNAVFLAPAVPVNRTKSTMQSDWLYLAFFKPQSTGEWLGNIKKYALGKHGEVYGKMESSNAIDTSQSVVDDKGVIMSNAISFWSTAADGNDVEKGGLGELLTELDNRNIYYYTGTNTDLTHESNKFALSNLSLPVSSTDTTNTLLFKTGFVNGAIVSTWKLGAIIHSEPSIVHYSTTQSVIFVGANDGMLHCFDDNTGTELWGFVPPGQEENENLSKISDNDRNYYVDGSIVITYGDLITGTQLFQPQLMIFGERRGGYNYYVLDISGTTGYLTPRWKYQMAADYLRTHSLGTEYLGQSWGKPKVCTFSTQTETVSGKLVPSAANLETVFIIPGGYDTNQDLPMPQANDTRGRAIFSVKTSTGAPGKFQVSKSSMASMNNCILDFNVVSPYRMADGTEIATRIYAGDLGGRVFVFADDRYTDGEGEPVKSRVPDGSFPTKNCLVSIPNHKIFYPPVTSKIQNTLNEIVVFGTGDRENVTEINNNNNGLYGVINKWSKNNLTQDNLIDKTSQTFIKNDYDLISKGIKDGWFFTFLDADIGERLISPLIITNGYVIFSTFVPATDEPVLDPCANVGGVGKTYLYAVRVDTGDPIADWNGDGTLAPEERRMGVTSTSDGSIATMAQPKLIGDYVITPKAFKIPTNINFNYFFWRQR